MSFDRYVVSYQNPAVSKRFEGQPQNCTSANSYYKFSNISNLSQRLLFKFWFLFSITLFFTEATATDEVLNRTDSETAIGVLDGVGFKVKCANVYEQLYREASEFDKAGSAAAATIMALIPSLLAFGPLKIANLRMVLHFGATASMITASFTCALPVEWLTTLTNAHRWDVRYLFGDKYKEIIKLTARDTQPQNNADSTVIPPTHATHLEEGPGDSVDRAARPDPSGREDIHVTSGSAALHSQQNQDVSKHPWLETLEKLQELYRSANTEDRRQEPLQILYDRATRSATRRPMRLTINFITAAYIMAQLALWYTAFGFVPQLLYYNFSLIWACPDEGFNIFASWVGIVLSAVSIGHTFLESPFFHADEVLHLSRKPQGIRVIKCPTFATVAPKLKGPADCKRENRGIIPGFAYTPEKEVTWVRTFCIRTQEAWWALRQV